MTYFYPGESGEWFGILFYTAGNRLALSHGARWWKTRTGLPTLWPSLCIQFYFLLLWISCTGEEGHLCDLPGEAPSQYKLSMSIVHSKAGNPPCSTLAWEGPWSLLQCSHRALLHNETWTSGSLWFPEVLWANLTSSPFLTTRGICLLVAYSTLGFLGGVTSFSHLPLCDILAKI